MLHAQGFCMQLVVSMDALTIVEYIYIYIKESGGRRGGGGGYKYRLIYGALGPEPYAAGINSAKCPFN